jgi:type I restriction enzyme S subunit
VEWLGEVPGHWEVKQLRHVANIVRGASPRPAGDPKFFTSEPVVGQTTPWVTVAEITKDAEIYLRDVKEYLTVLGAESSQFFPSGTLVFTNSGATLGVPKVLAIDCCANDGVLAFRDLSTSIDILFAYHFLSTTTDRLRTEMKQGGGQPNLNTDIVKNIGIALPPRDEQDAIVGYLASKNTKFDVLVTEARTAITLLQERRTALISAAVTGQIDVRSTVATEAFMEVA